MVIKKQYKHEYCVKCKQENPQDREICECGGRNFIFGDSVVYQDDKFKCECGSEEFVLSTHMNMNPIHNSTYMCAECKSPVGVQTYVKDYYGDCKD